MATKARNESGQLQNRVTTSKRGTPPNAVLVSLFFIVVMLSAGCDKAVSNLIYGGGHAVAGRLMLETGFGVTSSSTSSDTSQPVASSSDLDSSTEDRNSGPLVPNSDPANPEASTANDAVSVGNLGSEVASFASEVASDDVPTKADVPGEVSASSQPDRNMASGDESPKDSPEDEPVAGSGGSVQKSADDRVGASVGEQIDAPVDAWLNLQTRALMGAVLVVLGIATLVGRYLRRQPTEYVNPALVRRFRQRLSAWWLMCAILVFGIVLQPIGTVILFGLVSFWALREFITMTPTRRGDHRALFWALIVITPLQYLLIAVERSVDWQYSETGLYGLYSILIPVYASLLIPARVALSGDNKRFLERSAQITFGLLICVYSLSFAPALINLDLKLSNGTAWNNGSPAGLLFFLVLVSQLSDILQWTWGHLVGRRVIAPNISTSRTWEGFFGGTLSTGLLGAAFSWVTPFQFWEAMCMSMVIAVMGMFGGMTMSAIKRDRGVNDYGTLVLGHAGVLDRIDTLCFAAPVFYHLTRFFFT